MGKLRLWGKLAQTPTTDISYGVRSAERKCHLSPSTSGLFRGKCYDAAGPVQLVRTSHGVVYAARHVTHGQVGVK